MFVELKVLDNVGVSDENLVVVFNGNADDFFSAKFDFCRFHVLFVFEDIVRRFDQATAKLSQISLSCE